MTKRLKLKTALLLAAAVNVSYASESCVPPKKGQTPLDVLECLQSVQDAQQQQISELAAKTEKQQSTINSQQKRIVELENITGANRLLTFSSFVELDKKAVIKPGEKWTAPTSVSTFRRGPFRIALWVNVAGHPDHTQSTTVNVYHYCRGCRVERRWQKDPQIANWKIYGRDWGDNYIDLNISKVSDYKASYGHRTFKLKNTGEKTLEIFAYGVIQGPSGHIQQ
jgi:hypothetical protein